MDRHLIGLFLMFFAGSWVSNLSVIRTTTTLLQGSSLAMVLTVSSCAGLAFFVLLRLMAPFKRATMLAFLILPTWLFTEAFAYHYPGYPLWPALGALLFGELVKWHAYSQVLLRFGPLSAGRIFTGGVIAYELGTVGAALTVSQEWHWPWYAAELVAMAVLYHTFFVGKSAEASRPQALEAQQVPRDPLLGLIALGVVAGFLKVSADTGFKLAVRSSGQDMGQLVANFYLLSATFTLGLGFAKQLRWFAPRMGCPEASLRAQALSHLTFAVALFSGQIPWLVVATAFQRSMDKTFYQPTVQLLTSGFNPVTQELLRRWHVTAYLCLGSLLGLLAFLGHHLMATHHLMSTLSLIHLTFAVLAMVMVAAVVRRIVLALDDEAKRAGVLGGNRAMAMLALLSPRHFLVHALLWSHRSGGRNKVPSELLTSLTVEAGSEVVDSFYAAYTQMNEQHQMALVRMAMLLDRSGDRAFLLAVASEAVIGTLRARRLAAIHVVKVYGRMYRPLLRRARGKNSPLPSGKKAA